MVTNATNSASHGAGEWRRSQVWHVSAAGLAFVALLSDAALAQHKESAQLQASTGEGVANLPYARGKTFRTLDEYLAHLEAQGAVDLPWWREIRPGVYERVTSKPEAGREVATREELMRRFGFTR
jgi:hypothetical protein